MVAVKKVRASLFAEWAAQQLARWENLLRRRVIHRFFGSAEVIALVSDYDDIVLRVDYPDKGTRQYLGSYFAETFREVEIDEIIASHLLRERGSPYERRLQQLRDKIRQGKVLEPDELALLGDGDCFDALEEYLARHGSHWPVATVAAYWRRAHLPERALDVTAAVETRALLSKGEGPVWTTRGAAFVDVEELDEAERCAKRALECDPTKFHPHNVLGRVYCQRGDQKLADHHFAEAKSLGADERSRRDAERRGHHGRVLQRDDDESPLRE